MKRPLRNLLFLLAGVSVLGVLTFASGSASAQSTGGVGSGGNGGGSDSSGHWTKHGWGWRMYSTSGSGPADGFKSGTWNSAKAACSGHSANIVVFIIMDSRNVAMGYNYKSVYYGPPRYLGYLSAHPTYRTVPEARSMFNSLPAAVRSGFTFGSNVGWFCDGYTTTYASATLDGVKIDNATGVNPYGGNPGTPATVPYYSLRTRVSTASGTANPFTYTGAVKVTSASGTNATVSIDPLPAGSGWVLKGHTICMNGGAVACNSAYLTNPANIKNPGVRSFTQKFLPGKRYSMRWIFVRVTVPECLDPAVFNPAFPEPWQPFDLTTGVEYVNASYTPVNPRVDLTIRDAATNTVYPTNTQTPTKSGTNATYTFTNINLSAYPAGDYVATWGYTDASTARFTCTEPFYMGYKPYFTVLGGDTMVGDPAETDSSLQSWNNDNFKGLGYSGAGSQLAALTSGDTRSFATGRNIFNGPNLPASLAFANDTASIPGALYGGKYQDLPNRTDYYGSYISQATADARADVDIGTLASGVYSFAGDVTVHGSLPNRRDVKILSAGNVYVSGVNLGYNAYSSLSDIPRLGIFTQDGDIMISQNTTELHGTFSVGPGGKFYSCTLDASKTPVDYDDAGLQYAACNNGLTIYGSVSADELVLARTKDSLRKPNSEPAESFIYSPEVWLAAPGDFIVNSYIGLPPVL